MKQFLLFWFFLFLLLPGTKAQIWCAPGAQWHWGWSGLAEKGYVELTFVSDTVYEGKACHKITQHTKFVNQQFWTVTETFGYQVTYEENGVIYVYTSSVSSGSGWDTVYNFNAIPGDKWSILQAENNEYVEVNDTGHHSIQGYYLKWLTVTYHTGWSLISDTLYERIGCIGFNFPYQSSVLYADFPIAGFCNYSDNNFSNWPNSDEYCTELPTGISQLESKESIVVFPNPNQGEFTITCSEFGKEDGKLIITDISGRELFSRAVDGRKGNSITVSLGPIPPGIYYLSFRQKEFTHVGKIVVE